MSRALVKLLRHDAVAKTIPMDSEGWVPLHALARHFGATHEYLICMVAACHMDHNCRLEVAMAPAHPADLALHAWFGRHDLCGFPQRLWFAVLGWLEIPGRKVRAGSRNQGAV